MNKNINKEDKVKEDNNKKHIILLIILFILVIGIGLGIFLSCKLLSNKDKTSSSSEPYSSTSEDIGKGLYDSLVSYLDNNSHSTYKIDKIISITNDSSNVYIGCIDKKVDNVSYSTIFTINYNKDIESFLLDISNNTLSTSIDRLDQYLLSDIDISTYSCFKEEYGNNTYLSKMNMGSLATGNIEVSFSGTYKSDDRYVLLTNVVVDTSSSTLVDSPSNLVETTKYVSKDTDTNLYCLLSYIFR